MGAGILLRCPTNVLGDNAPSSLVDRCHSLPNSNIFFTYRQEQNCCFPVLEFSLSSMANSDLSNCSVRLSSQPRHCEPVRRLVWQSVLLFGKAGVIATFLGDADCHVASLLAMTWKFVRYRVNFKQFDKSEFDRRRNGTCAPAGAMQASNRRRRLLASRRAVPKRSNKYRPAGHEESAATRR